MFASYDRPAYGLVFVPAPFFHWAMIKRKPFAGLIFILGRGGRGKGKRKRVSLAFLLFCEARAMGWPWGGNLGFISLELFITSSVVEIMGK